MMDLKPIYSKSITNEIVKRISEALQQGEFKPGDKLPTETEFCQKLGVGRNSVREAIKMLAAIGVVEVFRGDGTYVATKVSPEIFNPLIFSLILEPRNAKDLYELRSMFESMVVLLAMRKATERDFEDIRQSLVLSKNLYASMQQTGFDAVNEEKINRLVELDNEFHEKILNATYNPFIIRIGKVILGLFTKYIRMSLLQKDGIPRSLENHSEILQTIKERDTHNVFGLIERTLNEWRQEVERTLSEEYTAPRN